MRISHLWRYPVKSLAGEELAQTKVDLGGIPADRRYMIRDRDPRRDGKPLTARQQARMLALQATARKDEVSVTAPDGRTFSMDDAFASYLAATLGRPLSIEASQDTRAFHDAHDILVINAASVRALAAEWGKPVDPLRFRPNIILEGDNLAPWVEDAWAGRSFRAGDARFAGVKRDERCAIPTIDPRTLEIDPSLLRLIVQRHEQCFGMYFTVATPGNIAVGDEWLPA